MSILDDTSIAHSGTNDGLSVTPEMKRNWITSSKWALFFAILGFIYIGFNLLTIGATSSIMQSIATLSDNPLIEAFMPMMSYMTVISLIFMAALFFVCFFHLRFATNIQRAVNFTDQDAFRNAWLNLRNHFRLYGIILCVVLALYLVLFIFMASLATTMMNSQ